jgi:hypothetical protein
MIEKKKKNNSAFGKWLTEKNYLTQKKWKKLFFFRTSIRFAEHNFLFPCDNTRRKNVHPCHK